MDKLMSLAVFVAAVEEGSIAGAARRLGLSSVMAGRYLTALEDALPARLVQRTTRQLALTDAGVLYLPRCKRILDELEEANHEVAATQSTPRGTLRVSAPVTFGAAFLAPVIADYSNDYPEVKVEVQLKDRFVDLIEEGVDIAIRIGKLKDSELIAQQISSCSLIACAAPAYLSRCGTPKSPAELASHVRIGYLGTVSTAPWSFEGPGDKVTAISDPYKFVTNNTQMMAEAAAAGLGIAYGPSFAFASHLERGALVQVLPKYATPTLPIHAVTPTARHMPQRVRAFRLSLAEAFSGGNVPWERWRKQNPSGQPRNPQRAGRKP
ncbi:LysR family transcriptional regulator [Acidovorax sp.]|uniref:LysR family transcriptional regulator n=1 Tax=Acidovorax sp. TaxID=1872122 RepID=UPI00260532D3|nr:LysR family transcriptional regulator [Acidovorax sp.]